MSEVKQAKWIKWVKTLVILVLAGLAVAALAYFGVVQIITDGFQKILVWIEGIGFWGPFIFILLYIFSTVFFIPGSLLTMGAGVIFGVIKGSIFVSIASTLGASAAFIVGRYLMRGWVTKKIDDKPQFKAVDAAVAQEGWKIVGLIRLSPVFPFSLINYAFGITKVSLRDYFFASWIGMMPGTVMYVYLGSLVGDLATLGAADGRQKSMGEWVLTIVGLLATVLVTVYVTRIARKALKTRLDSPGNQPQPQAAENTDLS